ncbi:MAG: hypothetical protein JWQ06_293, partial [Mucilaginibacter sp.]|nr:hypothetical protein [Mucilaginibacter sp.]
MRILVVCLFAGIFVVAYDYSFAQTKNVIIQGKVTTENNLAADLTSVILLSSADSSILKSTICNNLGLFKFTAIVPGNYLVLASKIGYNQALSGPYKVTGSSFSDISIKLIHSIPQLKEVSVTAQRSYIEVKPGKVVLNVQNSIIAEGNSVFDILRQAPGVHVDNQGDISIIGRQNALVTIDGKLTNLTGENLTGYLQSLQSGTVQQIELITNPSSKYDAASAGIINIISKKGTNIGTNGTITVGGGYGNYYKANTDLVFNSRTNKFNIFGNYNYSSGQTFHTYENNRIINYNGITSDYNNDYYTTQKKYNNNFKLGTDYYISAKHTLGIIVYGTIANSDFVKTNHLKIANNGTPDSTIITNSNLSRNFSDITYDINYNGTLDKSGKTLSADVLYNNNNRSSTEYITNNFYNAQGGIYRQPLSLQNLSPSDIHIWVTKIDYVNPISKSSKLEAGIKYSRVKSDNNLVFGPLVNGQYLSDPKFSNNFIYTENINSAYVNYTNTMGKLNVVAGLRAEQTNANGSSLNLRPIVNKSYLNFFPQVQLVYQYDKKNEFTLSFNRGIQRPLYTDLNPFLYYADLYDYRAGNPSLLPAYSNSIQLSHSYNKALITTLYAQITSGFYGFNDFQQNDSTKVNISTTQNFGTYSVYGLKFFAPVDITIWWSAGFLMDASYQRIKAYAVNGNLNKGTQYIELSTNQKFNISNTIAAEVVGRYESPTFYGINQFKANYNVDVGISKQLFSKKASLKLSVSDIFNT